MTFPLCQALAAPLPEQARGRLSGSDALESYLVASCQSARAAWPKISVGDAVFAGYLGERIGVWPDKAAPLAGLQLGDLFLACGCVRGDSQALAAFDKTHIAKVGLFVRKLKLPAAMLQDLMQLLREKMLIGVPPQAPKIASYAGRGSLEGWVRVSAVNAAMNLLRSEKRYAPEAEPEAIFDTPEVQHFRAQHEAAFSQAFAEAAQGLSERERGLLSLYFLDELSLERMAKVYQVHLSTVARWIEKARELLFDKTTALLRARLRLSAEELEDLWAGASAELAMRIAEHLRHATKS